ncbi:MAG: enoyl-CoA hydratase/isomerase family protein, partial [Alphaproteobacteria bacterium]
MADGTVEFTQSGTIGTITLCRPDKFNALNVPMLERLENCIEAAEAADVRVVLVCGQGKGFCAGGDIDAWSKLGPADFQMKWIRLGHRVFDRLAQVRQPVIAVMQGHALGGGLELAAAADFRVAEPHVKLGFPEAGIGVVPGWSGTQRAVRRFGAQAVRRMALGGEILLAGEALALGVIDKVAPPGEALAVATSWASEIAKRGPLASETVKMMIAVAEGEDPGAMVETLASGFVASTGDFKEGTVAFAQKNDPRFSRS